MPTADLIVGDCVQVMRTLELCSVDAIVTDPPYGLEFMGKDWDSFGRNSPPSFTHSMQDNFKGFRPLPRPGGLTAQGMLAFQEWTSTWALEAYRILKPGGHLLAFAGTRTYHRMVSGVEDAGFEIRDCIAWMYGSGFPKSLDVSKAIDARNGSVREVIGTNPNVERSWRSSSVSYEVNSGSADITAPATPDARRWQGWGTALKPAYEPIVVARKPLTGTVAANVLEWGTGGLNVDGCRIGDLGERARHGGGTSEIFPERGNEPTYNGGRWPANVVLDEQAAAALDEQSGESAGSAAPRIRSAGQAAGMFGLGEAGTSVQYGDSGGASRFFYVAKVSSAERNAGLDGFEATFAPTMGNGIGGKEHDPETATPKRNVHPTVKPIALMRWLTRLVTPPGGLVLDPFTGSGSTGCAAVLEGFHFLGIEQDAQYAEIARARLRFWAEHGEDGLAIVRRREASEAAHAELAAAGQLSLAILDETR